MRRGVCDGFYYVLHLGDWLASSVEGAEFDVHVRGGEEVKKGGEFGGVDAGWCYGSVMIDDDGGVFEVWMGREGFCN